MINFLKRFLAALLSSFILAVFPSLFFMNLTSYDFYFYFIGFFVIGGFAILLIGIPTSYLIDYILSRSSSSRRSVMNSVKTLLYAIAGFIGTFLLAAILSNNNLSITVFIEFLPFSILGIMGALLFFASLVFVNFLFEKKLRR